MNLLPLLVALQQQPAACIDPAAPLRELVVRAPLPATVDRKANEYVRLAVESGDRVKIWRALKRLEDVMTHRHDDMPVHLAYGLMQSVSSDLMPEETEGYRHRRVFDNSNSEDALLRHLVRAAEQDPGQWLVGVTLARVALGIRSEALLRTAHSVIDAQLQASPANGALRIARADLLLAQGRLSDALAQLDSVQQAGCDAALAPLAEARILRGDSLAAGAAYLSALEHASNDALHRFYDDARVVMSLEQRAAYRALPDAAARRNWLLDFWRRSAALSGRDVPERIVEHVRRLQYAHAHYRLTRSTERGGRPEQHVPIERAFHDDDVPWDARGSVYVRHGQPDRVVETKAGAGFYIPINATWVYFDDDPPRMVHFAQPQREGDPLGWYVVGTTFGGCGRVGGSLLIGNQDWHPDTMAAREPNGDDQRARSFSAQYYYDRAVYDPAYAVLGRVCEADGENLIPTMRLLVADLNQSTYWPSATRLLRTETAQVRYARALRASLAAYRFRTPRGAPELATVAWIHLGDAAEGAPLQKLRASLTLRDSTAVLAALDTLLAVPPGAVAAGGVMRIAHSWELKTASAPRLWARIEDASDPGRGGAAMVEPSPADASAQHLSDVVIGEADRPGPLVRGNSRIAPLAAHTIVVGQPFRAYFEVYGARAEEVLETTLLVRRIDERGRRELTRIFKGNAAQRELRFRDPATLDARGVAVRDVNVAGDLIPGEYELTVTVRGTFGVAARTTHLRVLAPR